MKVKFSLFIAIVMIVSSLGLAVSATAQTTPKKTYYWAEPTATMEPVFLVRPSAGEEERDYAIQFVAMESFSQFVLVLNGKGKMRISIYEWYFNYDATIEKEPVWTTEFSQPGDKEYVFDCDTIKKGEYILLLSEVEAEGASNPYIGMYTVPEPDQSGIAETWNNFDSVSIVCGGLKYDTAPTGEAFGEISLSAVVPGEETPAPTATITPEPTPSATEKKTTPKPNTTISADVDDDVTQNSVNTMLYIIIAIAAALIIVAIVYIILKTKKKD